MRASLATNLLLSRFGIIAAIASVFGVFWFASGREYVWAVVSGLGVLPCVLWMKHAIERDRRAIELMVAELRHVESMPFEEACAKVAEGSVAIAGELARMREFPSPPPPSRHRYFEREEIVFRLDEKSDGFTRLVVQNLKRA